jgi:hypothetical protein
MRWVITILIVHSATARAEAPAIESYGKDIALVDGASVGLFTGGIAILSYVDDKDIRIVGVVPCLIGGLGYWWLAPSLHAGRRGNVAVAASAGLRVLLPIGGVVLGKNLGRCPGGGTECHRADVGALLGLVAGVGAASTIDAIVLARSPVPYVAPTNGGTTVGIVGRF